MATSPKLYTMSGTCALAPHIALEWIGEPYELEVMKHGDHLKSEYLKVNPKGKVPALVIEDGKVLTEAAAILMYLIDRYPQANLGTGNDAYERYLLEEWLSYMTSEVHADFAPHFAPQKFIDDESQHDAVRQATYKRLREHYKTLNERLDKHPIARGRTVADPYLYVITRWIDQTPIDINDYPNLKRFREEMSADAGVKKALEMQGMS
jgi:glutathione S-transferase